MVTLVTQTQKRFKIIDYIFIYRISWPHLSSFTNHEKKTLKSKETLGKQTQNIIKNELAGGLCTKGRKTLIKWMRDKNLSSESIS